MKILFTICGRAGSKGFKNKNLKILNGIPLVYYTLAAIQGFRKNNPEYDIRAALNTDSDQLRNLVEDQHIFPDIQYVPRKDELAGDKVAKVEVIKDTYFAVKEKAEFDVVIDLDITSPLRTIRDIENVFCKFKTKADYDVVFTVVNSRRSPYFNMVEQGNDGFYKMICTTNFTMRQQAPECYEMNASIYAYRPAFLKSDINGTILDYRCGISLMSDYLVLDIDSEEDFTMMSYLHKYYITKDMGLKYVYDIAQKWGKK